MLSAPEQVDAIRDAFAFARAVGHGDAEGAHAIEANVDSWILLQSLGVALDSLVELLASLGGWTEEQHYGAIARMGAAS